MEKWIECPKKKHFINNYLTCYRDTLTMSNRGRKSTSGLKKASVKDSRSTAAKKGKENNSIKGKISQATRNGSTKNSAKNKAYFHLGKMNCT